MGGDIMISTCNFFIYLIINILLANLLDYLIKLWYWLRYFIKHASNTQTFTTSLYNIYMTLNCFKLKSCFYVHFTGEKTKEKCWWLMSKGEKIVKQNIVFYKESNSQIDIWSYLCLFIIKILVLKGF